jgi:hypothetical protein
MVMKLMIAAVAALLTATAVAPAFAGCPPSMPYPCADAQRKMQCGCGI